MLCLAKSSAFCFELSLFYFDYTLLRLPKEVTELWIDTQELLILFHHLQEAVQEVGGEQVFMPVSQF